MKKRTVQKGVTLRLRFEPLALFGLSICATAAIACVLRFIEVNYFRILFWDQWVYGVQLIDFKWTVLNVLEYLFRPHNEHVIAPSHLLFLLDLKFFDLTNGPLIWFNVAALVAAAFMMARVTLEGVASSLWFFAAFLVFSSALLSLAQWENLLWGFQSQFSFLLLGALSSLLLAERTTRENDWACIIALVAAIGFTVFSAGSGILVVAPVLAILILRRAAIAKIGIVAAASAIFGATYFFLVWHTIAGEPTSGRTIGFLLRFGLTVIGAPMAPNELTVAPILGALILVVATALVFATVVKPFLKMQPIDGATLVLLALAGFAIETAFAAAWARASFGIGAAFWCRYSTLMLPLWVVLLAVPMRSLLLSGEGDGKSKTMAIAVLSGCLGVAVWSSAAQNMLFINEYSRDRKTEAYFVASGVRGGLEFSRLFGEPSAIRGAIDIMQRRRLNIFASDGGLSMPGADQLLLASKGSALSRCAFGGIDAVKDVDAHSREASGWIATPHRQTPAWIISVDNGGKILGFIKPFAPRPDIATTFHWPHDVSGFVVPIVGEKSDGFFVVALNEDAPPCQLSAP